jgi:site-specific DNA-cytosine methylase
MRILVLFDGAALARLGLERSGHECIGVELNPVAHHLSKFVGSGNSILADVKDVMKDPLKYISEFGWDDYDAIWASPPCQIHSVARTQGSPVSAFAEDLLDWSLQLDAPILWVENVIPQGKMPDWGNPYNAAQFEDKPRQIRNRMIGGHFKEPKVHREYRKWYPELGKICPTVTATEFRGSKSDTRRASRFYGRKLTIEECAYHMGFDIPNEWWKPMPGFTEAKWREEIYRAIGNGVPVFMAKAFGDAYK